MQWLHSKYCKIVPDLSAISIHVLENKSPIVIFKGNWETTPLTMPLDGSQKNYNQHSILFHHLLRRGLNVWTEKFLGWSSLCAFYCQKGQLMFTVGDATHSPWHEHARARNIMSQGFLMIKISSFSAQKIESGWVRGQSGLKSLKLSKGAKLGNGLIVCKVHMWCMKLDHV